MVQVVPAVRAKGHDLSLRARGTLNTVAMLLSDTFSVSLSLLFAAAMVAWGWSPEPRSAVWALALVFAWLASAAGDSMYPGWGLGAVRELRRSFRAATISFAGAAAVSVAVAPPFNEGWLLFLVVAWLAAGFLVPLARAAVRAVLARTGGWGAPALIIGSGGPVRLLARQLLQEPDHGFQPVALLDPDALPETRGGQLPVYTTVTAAAAAGAAVAVFALPDSAPGPIRNLVDEALTRFNRVIITQGFLEAQSLGVATTSFGDTLAFDVRRTLSSRFARLAKRVFDLLCVTIAAPFWIPIVAVTALLTWLEDRHAPFYRQERVGTGGRIFKVWKLRTMVPNAEAALRAHLEANPAARAEWEKHFKLKRDPRITRWGRFFRKVSLDELPQLFNVVVGEMSLVGPRPLPTYHHEALPARAAELRTRSLPGLTGLWQVEGRSDTDLQGMAVLDTRYIRNWSFWLDLVILARTVVVVVRGKGAY